MAVPLNAVLASIPSYPRPVIERLVARAIEWLDEMDGDPDLEDDDREADDDREPEPYEGGYADYSNFLQSRGDDLTPYSVNPHPDLARIKRELRRRK